MSMDGVPMVLSITGSSLSLSSSIILIFFSAILFNNFDREYIN